MTTIARVFDIFGLKRISGQIAALIFASLLLIHALIAGYFLISPPTPRSFPDEPLRQFELFAQLIARTPLVERDTLVHQLDAAFPQLRLHVRTDGAEAPKPGAKPMKMRRNGVELFKNAGEPDTAWFHLADGAILEAAVTRPKRPPFLGALWTNTFLFLLVSITLLGFWAARALSSPLSAFARAVESFGLNPSPSAIPESGPEEIRTAAKALNRMSERIGLLMNDRTRMLAAISHDLRTPITRLRLRSEYIEDESQRTQSLRDLDQMQSMLESVLSFLRSGSAGDPTLVDIAALLQTVCDEFSDCGHSVSYEGPRRATLTIRSEEVRRAVTNLVDNAVRFGSEVVVRLIAGDTNVMIEVSDNGPGIPNDRKLAMLEPFVRGEKARTLDATSGFGLGLSIAQAVAHAHDGSLSLHDNEPHGLVVKIVLPVHRAMQAEAA